MSDRRNVVMVTVDSLRADHCGFMGYDAETTPTLDEMAADGIAFENAVSPGPSTYDSMPAIFTGDRMTPLATPGEGDGDSIDSRTRNIALNMYSRTIPEWFDDQGYATAAFTTNPYTGAHTAFGRGFDSFEDFLDGGEGALMRKAAHVPVLSELKHLVTLVRGDRASKSWTEYVDDIVEWVEDAPEPYFLWVFLLDTHTPYLVPKAHRTETDPVSMYYHNWRLWLAKKWLDSDGSSLNHDELVSLYDDTIRSVDTFLDRLRTDLADTDPAVVVHADHGEAFGEHGTYGHESLLYEENVHVPLVVDNGGESSNPSAPVSLTRLPELVRAVAVGNDRPSEAVRDDAPAVAKSWDGTKIALRGPDWKYVATVDADSRSIVAEETYELESDPEERRDVTEERRELAECCRDRVRRILSHQRESGAISSAVEATLEDGGENERLVVNHG